MHPAVPFTHQAGTGLWHGTRCLDGIIPALLLRGRTEGNGTAGKCASGCAGSLVSPFLGEADIQPSHGRLEHPPGLCRQAAEAALLQVSGCRPHQEPLPDPPRWRAALGLHPQLDQFASGEVAECGDLSLQFVVAIHGNRSRGCLIVVNAIAANAILADLARQGQSKPLLHGS